MKRNYILLVVLLHASLLGYSQISSRTVAAPVAGISTYDSLNNINVNEKEDFKQYIGQELFIAPPANGKNFGYLGFTTEPKWVSSSGSAYKYKPVNIGGGYYTDKKVLENKYFKILDYIEKAEEATSGSFSTGEKYKYLKLQSKENNDILYYQLQRQYGDKTHFIVVGCWDKLKQRCTNHEYVFVGDEDESHADMNNGNPIVVKPGSAWACTDLAMINIDGYDKQVLVYVFKNSTGGEIAVSTEELDEIPVDITEFIAKAEYDTQQKAKAAAEAQIAADKRAKQEQDSLDVIKAEKDRLAREKQAKLNAQQAKEQATKDAATSQAAKEKRKEDLIKKYGATNGALIAAGQVQVGMTAQMCIDAWGKPTKINTTTSTYGTREQWVYNHTSYLYFKDGILTSIQN